MCNNEAVDNVINVSPVHHYSRLERAKNHPHSWVSSSFKVTIILLPLRALPLTTTFKVLNIMNVNTTIIIMDENYYFYNYKFNGCKLGNL